MLSLCLLTAILVVVGVSLQLMGLCSRAGLYGPGTAFLLHPLHCTLCLCRWQTLTAGFVWAGGSQRCLRCLNSSFSRQLSMPGTLFTSLVANTLNCSPRGWEGKAQWVKSDPPPNPSPGLRGQKISWTVQSRWVGSGRQEHEGFWAVCATQGTYCCQESIRHGQQCGETKPPFTRQERSAQQARLLQKDVGMTSASAAHAIFMQLIWETAWFLLFVRWMSVP